MAHVNNGACRLVSRNGNLFKSFPTLCAGMGAELIAQGHDVIASQTAGVNLHTGLDIGRKFKMLMNNLTQTANFVRF